MPPLSPLASILSGVFCGCLCLAPCICFSLEGSLMLEALGSYSPGILCKIQELVPEPVDDLT